MTEKLPLAIDALRAVAGFCAGEAEAVLALFERAEPGDARARRAIAAARGFAEGGARSKAMRQAAFAALKAANATADPVAAAAARAAMLAASAAYLHPIARATQLHHILGASVHPARAREIAAGDDGAVGARAIADAAKRADPCTIAVLRRYPPAPEGGGRAGELTRMLDTALRG